MWRGAALLTLVLAVGCGEGGLLPGAPAQFEIRPTDGTGWNNNGYGAVTVLHWDTPSGTFRMHYTEEGIHKVPATDSDASGVPDFVETFGKTFDEIYGVEVGTLGFRPPLDDSLYHDRPDFGGDGRFDVYLQDRGGSSDGYAVVEACKPSVPYQCAGYMVVENDFAGYSYATPLEGMQVLASHEFFHVILNAYRVDLPGTFTEAMAVWATEQVYPELDDFEHFLPYFFKEPHRSLDHELGSPSDLFPYGLAIWPQFLGQRFGVDLLPAVLAEVSDDGPSDNDLDAIDAVLARDKQSSLAEAFAEFALWNYFTGSRASGHQGYAEAAELPMLSTESVAGPLPTRISGEIAYLAARYYTLTVPAGQWIRVTSERPQPMLALHLVSGEGDETRVVSATVEQGAAEIQSQGKVTIVAASTARKDRHLPLSLAVVEIAEPGPVTPPTDGGVGDGDGDGGDGGGGCTVGRGAGTGGGGVLTLLVLGLLLRISRRRRSAGGRARWSRAPRALVALLALVVLAAGCSDDSDETPADGGQPLADLAADLGPDTAVGLGVGQFEEFVADSAGQIRASVPTSGTEKFLALLISEDSTPLAVHDYTATLAGTSAGQSLGGSGSPTKAAPGPWNRPCDFAQRVNALLASRPKTLVGEKPYAMAGTPPKVGDQREFQIRAGGTTHTITAEALVVDGTAAYWIDRTTTPLATIDSAMLQQVAQGFSTIVVPRERIYFGHESDINGDGVISVLFSPLVAEEAVAFVSPCDLVDPKVVPGCSVSNQMELVYVSTPDKLPGHYNSATALLETIAHEFQHAIYFFRKYILNNSTKSVENPYVTEGLSALAQDLTGYQAGNLYVVMAALEHADVLSVPNLTEDAVASYVPQPEDGYMRGGGYLLLRYLFDQAGGDAMESDGTPVDKGGITWLRQLVDAKEIGAANYEGVSGLSAEQMITGFWSAMALSNRGPDGAALNPEPVNNFLPTTTDPLTQRQRGCNLFASFHGMQMLGTATQPFSGADGKLRAGGAELLELSAQPGQDSLAVSVETPPAARARLRLIRLK